MKAAGFKSYGAPDLLQLRDVEKPVPKSDEVLVRVHAASINSWDWEFQSGKSYINRLMFGLFRPKPSKQILGADIAGTVDTVGRKVTRFRPADAVFGDLWANFGGFAEYAVADEHSLELKPTNSSFAEAAAIPQAGVLALQAIGKAGTMGPGRRVLINGGGGGVGTFAIQIAKSRDAHVTGVDRAQKLDTMLAVGADHVIDYETQDFTKTGERYDLIVDVNAVRSMFDFKRALAPGGTYAMVGGSVARMLQGVVIGKWRWLASGRRFCLVAEGPNKGLSDLRDLVEDGKVVPRIDGPYPFSQITDAYRRFAEGRHTGKVVITIAE